jgi:hypothetical protein
MAILKALLDAGLHWRVVQKSLDEAWEVRDAMVRSFSDAGLKERKEQEGLKSLP